MKKDEVKIKYFGVLSEVTGCEEEIFPLSSNFSKPNSSKPNPVTNTETSLTVQQLIEILYEKHPSLKNWDFQVTHEQNIAHLEEIVSGEIALLPPFSGG